jgi:hypothetical protein
MPRHRTAQGKMIDMNALIAKNEKVRAVGNMSVNARGDTIDDTGKIVVPVTQKVGQKYAKTVGNRSANVTKSAKPEPVQEDLTKEEQDLDSAMNDDIEIEQIKAKETKK